MSEFTTNEGGDETGHEVTEYDATEDENVHQFEDLTDVDGIMEPYAEQEGLEHRTGRSLVTRQSSQGADRRHSADPPLSRKSSFNNNARSGSPQAERVITRRATFYDGEYIPESPSLFRTTSARVLDAQALNDRQQMLNTMKSPTIIKIDEGYVPSDRLMRTTSARVMNAVAWEEQKKLAELQKSPPPPKIDDAYQPSERLLKTTRSMIFKAEQWEEEKEKNKFKDDIWWDKRNELTGKTSSKPTSKHNPVASKLNEPTRAYLASKRGKAPQRPESAPSTAHGAHHGDSPVKEHAHIPAKLDKDHPLLRQTKATKASEWNERQSGFKSDVGGLPLHLPSKQTGPKEVKSKLHEETSSIKGKKKVFTAEFEEKLNEQAAAVSNLMPRAAPVRTASSAILTPTTAHALRARPKSPEREVHPGEKSWNPYAAYAAKKTPPRSLAGDSRPRSALTTTANASPAAKAAAGGGHGSSRNTPRKSPGSPAAAAALGGGFDGDDTTGESASHHAASATSPSGRSIPAAAKEKKKSTLVKHKSRQLSGSQSQSTSSHSLTEAVNSLTVEDNVVDSGAVAVAVAGGGGGGGSGGAVVMQEEQADETY